MASLCDRGINSLDSVLSRIYTRAKQFVGPFITMGKGPAEITHGYMFTGFAINVLLYGITLAQTYIYYATYARDRLWIKILVVVLLLADTLNTIFEFAYLYTALIIHFADVAFLIRANWYIETVPVLTGIISTLVQLFFAWRVWVFAQSWVFTALVTLGALAGGGCAIATGTAFEKKTEFSEFRKFKGVVTVWLTASVFTDVLITVVLVWHLRKHKTGFQRSNFIVDRIIRMTVQTGLVTSVVAILNLIFFLKDPSGIHLLFNFPLGKLYTNSLMSGLNARQGWKLDSNSAHSGGAILSAQMFNQNPTVDPTSSSNDGYMLKDVRPSIPVKLGPSSRSKNNVSAKQMEHQNSADVKVYPGVVVHIESHQTTDMMYPSQKNISAAESQQDTEKGYVE